MLVVRIITWWLRKLTWPIRLASRGSDSVTFFTAPSIPYENLEPEEISETKENDPAKDDNTTKENQPTAPTDHTPECFTQEGPARDPQEAHTTIKKKPIWNRFKETFVRSAAL